MVSAQAGEILNSLEEKLYSESTIAKIWGVAVPALGEQHPPTKMPEYSYGRYEFRDIQYWTAGFFPGSLYALLERSDKYPHRFPSAKLDPAKLEFGAKWWAEALYGQASRTDTHDLGFIIQPSMQRDYERSKSERSLDCLIRASDALSERFDENVGCIRSWDTAVNKRYKFIDKEKDFIVIIDNMCNLDMLYYASSVSGNLKYSTIATRHAEVTLKNHFRLPEYSTYHVVNYDKSTGEAKARFTNQGFSDDSTWARGQSWSILGYIETYSWTKQKKFLEASINAAEFFLSKLDNEGAPAWDFGAPDGHIKDSSAGMIAAYGILKIFETTGEEKYLISALKLIQCVVSTCMSNQSYFKYDGSVELGESDSILKRSTINNNPDTFHKLTEHGLVYADYYFLCIGNKLLELGLFK